MAWCGKCDSRACWKQMDVSHRLPRSGRLVASMERCLVARSALLRCDKAFQSHAMSRYGMEDQVLGT